jgi:hypothetical protein
MFAIAHDKKVFQMPTKENYSQLFISEKYTIKQLRTISLHYKINLSGLTLKAELIKALTNYFQRYDKARLIQTVWRKALFRKYNNLRGPARFKRAICVNETDFFTMDSLKDIPWVQFYSFTDVDNKTYGFDLISLYNLFDKSRSDKPTNPYNRNPLPPTVQRDMLKILRLSKLFKEHIQIVLNEETTPAEPPDLEYRALTLFHDIDILGNYTDPTWFTRLGQPALVRFIVELNDIWTYRANLSEDVRREICPRYRDLFRNVYVGNIAQAEASVLFNIALRLMERLVRDGINVDSRSLGANYVLCALTLVSPAAANALPWLFQSVI